MNPPIDQQFRDALRLHQSGQLAEAAGAYHAILATEPRHADALGMLGTIAHQSGDHTAAVELLGHAVSIDPENARAFNNLGEALRALGAIEHGAAAYRRAIALDPNHTKAHSNLLLTLHFRDADPLELRREHEAWNRQHAARFSLGARPHEPASDGPDRPLRIGYVSPDFKRHSVAYFIEPILAAHDRDRFHVTCYSNTARADDVTARLMKHADVWRDIRGVDDERAARIVRDDRIDVLLDLTGHMAQNRLLLFARKPAPIQATYLGYPNGTGLAAIDYRITDAVADPPGLTDDHSVERIVRLPRSAWCYRPPDDAPDVRVPRAGGPITFGSFNKLPKISPAVIETWARILQRVPDSRLLIKSKSFADAALRQRTLALFAQLCIAGERLTLQAWSPEVTNHLDLYNTIDIALDTFPYTGTTTTCEAMWMGVPVISLAGGTHVSRVGASLLNSVALSDLAAPSVDAYVELAAALVCDESRRAHLRATLRDRMRSSPLTDARRITADLEAAYLQMWRDRRR